MTNAWRPHQARTLIAASIRNTCLLISGAATDPPIEPGNRFPRVGDGTNEAVGLARSLYSSREHSPGDRNSRESRNATFRLILGALALTCRRAAGLAAPCRSSTTFAASGTPAQFRRLARPR